MKKKFPIFVIIAVILAFLLSLAYIFGVYLPDRQLKKEHEAFAREYYSQKLRSFALENESIVRGETDVLFIGDSLTDGYDVAKYYPDLKVLNRGIGGDTTFGLEDRLEESVYAVQPKTVVMLIGANNMDRMFENYEDILISMKENLPDSRVILLSLTSMGGDWGRKNHLAAYNNVKIKALAEEYGFAFVDLYTPLLNLATDEIYEEYTTDGGHLTPLGYEILTANIRPAIDKALLEE